MADQDAECYEIPLSRTGPALNRERPYHRITLDVRSSVNFPPIGYEHLDQVSGHINTDRNKDDISNTKTTEDRQEVVDIYMTTPARKSNLYDEIPDRSSVRKLSNATTKFAEDDNQPPIYDRLDENSIACVVSEDPSKESHPKTRLRCRYLVLIVVCVFLAVMVAVIAVPVWMITDREAPTGSNLPPSITSTQSAIPTTRKGGETMTEPSEIICPSTAGQRWESSTIEEKTTSIAIMSTPGTTSEKTFMRSTTTTEQPTTTTPTTASTTVTATTLPAGCGSEWIRYEDTCYRIITTPRDWVECSTACKAMDASLLALDSEEKQTFVDATLVPAVRMQTTHWEFWLGGLYQDERWVWVGTQESVDPGWSSWGYRGSGSHDVGDCLSYRIQGSSTNRMFDFQCTHERPFICEKNFGSVSR